MYEVERDKITRNCIIDSVAFISRKALREQRERYYREPMELVNDLLIAFN